MVTFAEGKFFVREVGFAGGTELGRAYRFCARPGCMKKPRIWTPRGNHCSDECADITLGLRSPGPVKKDRGTFTPARSITMAKKDKQEAEAQETATATQMPEQNGVRRPKPGTATGRVWEIFDQLSEEKGEPAARKDVLEVFTAEGGNPSTGATQYGRARKFYGLAGTRASSKKNEDEGASEDAPEVEE